MVNIGLNVMMLGVFLCLVGALVAWQGYRMRPGGRLNPIPITGFPQTLPAGSWHRVTVWVSPNGEVSLQPSTESK